MRAVFCLAVLALVGAALAQPDCVSLEAPFDGSFETTAMIGGDPWIFRDIPDPFFPIDYYGEGVSPAGFNFFETEATEGTQVVAHGFDGGDPGMAMLTIEMEGGITALTTQPPMSELFIAFDYRMGWNLRDFPDPMGGPTLNRNFTVDINGAGPVLVDIMVADTVVEDTGSLTFGTSIPAFAGPALSLAVTRPMYSSTITRAGHTNSDAHSPENRLR